MVRRREYENIAGPEQLIRAGSLGESLCIDDMRH